MAKVRTVVECNGPLDANMSVSGQVILDLSKLKKVIPRAPAKIGGGFKIGGSGNTNIQGKALARADLEDKLLRGDAAGTLGASGGGTIQAGGFAMWDDKLFGADGEIHGSAMLRAKTVYIGDVGVDEDGNGILKANTLIKTDGKTSRGATLSIATDKDALVYVEAYGKPNALNNLNKTMKA